MKTNYYITTNRSIVIERKGEKLIECINSEGKDFPSGDLRFARYNIKNGDIKVVEDSKGEINYASDDEKGSVEIFKEIYQQMIDNHKNKNDKNYDLLLYVHGFANDNEDIKGHMEYLNKKYVGNDNSPIEVVMVFYWTTNGVEKSLRHYYDDQDDATIAGKAFARLYMKLDQFFDDLFYKKSKNNNPVCGNNIHLMCHSMGNQVLHKMIENLSRKTTIKKNLKEIVLLAPDSDNDLFEDSRAFSQLPKLAERVHVYYHRKDQIIKLSNRLNKKNRLGHGPKNVVRIPGINFIDVTKTTGDIKQGFRDELGQHWFHRTIPKVIDDINMVLTSENVDQISGRIYNPEKNIYFLE